MKISRASREREPQLSVHRRVFITAPTAEGQGRTAGWVQVQQRPPRQGLEGHSWGEARWVLPVVTVPG